MASSPRIVPCRVKQPPESQSFANHTRDRGETLEPWSFSASVRLLHRLLCEANLAIRRRCRPRTVAERDSRRNLRPAERLSVLFAAHLEQRPSLTRPTLRKAPRTDQVKRWLSFGFKGQALRLKQTLLASVTSRQVGGRYGNRTRDSQSSNLVLYPLS